MTEAEARARVSAQASEAQRLAIADHVIDTNGSLEQTRSQVDEIWRELSTA
jgi:dephospho-CoA kinase